MIDLEPIPHQIQKQLFEKKRVLSRDKNNTANISKSKDIQYGLTHAKMATRSTFLRMTSGQLNPVILQGGKLAGNNPLFSQVPSGYDEVYGLRSYKLGGVNKFQQETVMSNPENNPFFSENIKTVVSSIIESPGKETAFNNPTKRPTPGVKSIDASFKGGVRALREATISWTCWDWEELNLLMPHFLAHGKTVMVEWGWVYDANSIYKLFDFIEEDGVGNTKISANAFTDYRSFIAEKEGDMDMMVGIVKNFEFTTREDGGFDCQTIISSVGASIMNTPQPNETILDPGITYNLSINENSKQVAKSLEDATGQQENYAADFDEAAFEALSPKEQKKAREKNKVPKNLDQDPLIQLDTNITLKSFIKNIDSFLEEKIPMNESGITKPLGAVPPTHYIYGEPNKWLLTRKLEIVKGRNDEVVQSIDNAWVRWGWFEDNILSKFLSITSNQTQKVITEFRSVNKVAVTDTTPNGYESVRIKNNPELETVNINRYILPGQFYPQHPRDVAIDTKTEFWDIKVDTISLQGDDKYFHKLRDVVLANYDGFATKRKLITIGQQEVGTGEFEPFIAGHNIKQTKGFWTPWKSDDEYEKETIWEKREIMETVDITESVPIGDEGFLRNMLINTKVLKEAFSVANGKITAETTNVLESIQTMFSLLNQDLNYWNFNLKIDDSEDKRAKIVDEQVTAFDFNIPVTEQVSTEENPTGVFYFPVWQKGSMVKTQNISAKVPDELALTTMYGANMDQLKDFANPGSQFSDKSGVALAGLYNNQLDEDKKQLDIAIKNSETTRIGAETVKPDVNPPLRAKDDPGEDIITFIKSNSQDLEQAYEERLKDINESLKTSALAARSLPKFNTGIPVPMIADLEDEEIVKLLKYEVEQAGLIDSVTGQLKLPLGKLLSAKFYDTGEMKAPYIRTVNYLTTQHGIFKEANNPLLIPLEIELEIDGIGGIYPGNSFHSSYVPQQYQEKTLFQAFDVNHKLDSSGWSTTIVGKMRSTISQIFTGFKTLKQVKAEQFENYLEKAKADKIAAIREDWRKKASVVYSSMIGKSSEELTKEKRRITKLYQASAEAEVTAFLEEVEGDS